MCKRSANGLKLMQKKQWNCHLIEFEARDRRCTKKMAMSSYFYELSSLWMEIIKLHSESPCIGSTITGSVECLAATITTIFRNPSRQFLFRRCCFSFALPVFARRAHNLFIVIWWSGAALLSCCSFSSVSRICMDGVQCFASFVYRRRWRQRRVDNIFEFSFPLADCRLNVNNWAALSRINHTTTHTVFARCQNELLIVPLICQAISRVECRYKNQ